MLTCRIECNDSFKTEIQVICHESAYMTAYRKEMCKANVKKIDFLIEF